MEKWDVVVLLETWMDERGWKKRSAKMPKGFKWGTVSRKKEQKKENNGGDSDGYQVGTGRKGGGDRS